MPRTVPKIQMPRTRQARKRGVDVSFRLLLFARIWPTPRRFLLHWVVVTKPCLPIAIASPRRNLETCRGSFQTTDDGEKYRTSSHVKFDSLCCKLATKISYNSC